MDGERKDLLGTVELGANLNISTRFEEEEEEEVTEESSSVSRNDLTYLYLYLYCCVHAMKCWYILSCICFTER